MQLRTCPAALLLFCALPFVAYSQEQGTPPSTPPQTDAPSKPTGPLRVGGNIMMQSLISQAMPIYPEFAKKAHISGTIVLHAIIGKEGTVEDLMYVSGPMELMRAAIDAARQWRYKPTLLNGEHVAVDTTISIVFKLDDSAAVSSPSVSQIPTPSLADDPQFQADVRLLLETTHYMDSAESAMRSMFVPLRTGMLESFPPTPNREKILDAYLDKLIGLLDTDEFITEVTRVYAKYLSDDDLKVALAFYETPAGQRMNAVMPKLFGDLTRVGQDLAREHLPDIFQQLCKDYPELQGEAKFCRADNEKKSLLLNPNPFSNGN
jgi:TonB family protein